MNTLTNMISCIKDAAKLLVKRLKEKLAEFVEKFRKE
jgi:hypothetical protein